MKVKKRKKRIKKGLQDGEEELIRWNIIYNKIKVKEEIGILGEDENLTPDTLKKKKMEDEREERILW